MTKEHIFNISVDVDDEAIRNGIIKSAQNQFSNTLMGELFEKDYYGRNTRIGAKLAQIITGCVDNLLQEYKDEIITEAARQLVEKTSRSKAFKEAMKGITENGE